MSTEGHSQGEKRHRTGRGFIQSGGDYRFHFPPLNGISSRTAQPERQTRQRGPLPPVEASRPATPRSPAAEQWTAWRNMIDGSRLIGVRGPGSLCASMPRSAAAASTAAGWPWTLHSGFSPSQTTGDCLVWSTPYSCKLGVPANHQAPLFHCPHRCIITVLIGLQDTPATAVLKQMHGRYRRLLPLLSMLPWLRSCRRPLPIGLASPWASARKVGERSTPRQLPQFTCSPPESL